MRAKFENRKAKELKDLIKEEEARVDDWKKKMTADIDAK